MPEHKHLIIRATVYEPITSEKELKKWLRDLVKIIESKPISKTKRFILYDEKTMKVKK